MERYLYIICIKLTAANGFVGNFYFFVATFKLIATAVFQNPFACLFRSNVWPTAQERIASNNLLNCLKQSHPSKHFNVVSTLFLGWYDVATPHKHHINIEKTLCKSTLKFRTLNNVESMWSISALIWTTLDNVETTLSFSL